MKKAAAVKSKKPAAKAPAKKVAKAASKAVKKAPKKAASAPVKKVAKAARKVAGKKPALAVMDEVTLLSRDLEADLQRTVRAVAKGKGSSPVTYKRILEVLELEESVESKEWALKVFDAMIDRDLVVKGVLNREAEETRRILEAEGKTISHAELSKSGKSKLARVAQGAGGPLVARLISVPIGEVVVCPLNPRKRIDPGSIEEMADSILEHGILQPPIARPGKYQDTYEVVFGQRRLLGKRRAIEKAKEEGRPAMAGSIELLLREMDDRTVLEEAWVENLQRVDVGVREEVEGFRAMLELRDEDGRPCYSVSSLAVKLGKAKSYVSNRMKLTAVPEEMWQALEAEKVGIRHLVEVGRLPTEGARKKAAGMVLRPKFRPEGQVLTVRETMDMIRDEFTVSLRGCPWDLKDADLVPEKKGKKGERLSGGACEDCPCRAGSDPELQEALSGNQHQGAKQGIDANSCLMPACFKEKMEAHWKLTMQRASGEGVKVLSPEEAKKVFPSWGARGPMPSSGYVALDMSPSYHETGHHAGEDTLPPWEKMLGKVSPEELVVARNELTGDIHRMLPRERAIELAEASLGKKGKDSPFSNRPGAKREPSGSRQESGPPEWQTRYDREKKLARGIREKLLEAVNLQKAPSEAFLTELVLGSLWDVLNYDDGLMGLLNQRGLPKFDDEKGDDDEKARVYLDEVVGPEVARAPLAWAALAFFEMVEQQLSLDDEKQGGGLLRALNLDREVLLAVEKPTEEVA